MGILSVLSATVVSILSTMGYQGLFLMMVLESTAVPVPSEAVMPFAGFVVFSGTFDFMTALAVATLGSIVGSALSYYVGVRAGRPFLLKYGRWFLISRRELEWTERFAKRRGFVAIFAARFIPAVRHVISIPAGTARMPFVPFVVATAAGAAIWNGLLLWVGVKLGERWHDVGTMLAPYENVVLIALVLAAICYVVLKLRELRKN
ncbi:MAG: DedA family protein [Candidatus Aenigmatarchaeota archaeon]|nr:MAG: DedA family protein [Candidatus Aenigmarchaeota archaeon]